MLMLLFDSSISFYPDLTSLTLPLRRDVTVHIMPTIYLLEDSLHDSNELQPKQQCRNLFFQFFLDSSYCLNVSEFSLLAHLSFRFINLVLEAWLV